MDALNTFVLMLMLLTLRLLPVMVIPSMSPLAWAPALVRIVVLLSLSISLVSALPAPSSLPAHVSSPLGLALALLSELLIGAVFGLAVLLPNAALHSAGWIADMQASLSAAALFDPAARLGAEALIGRALLLLATVVFFVSDLHLALFRGLSSSLHVLPLGSSDYRLEPEALLSMLGRAFSLALMVVAPVMLGMLAVDVVVAYATRSMPQANVYFLALPLKVALGLWMLSVTLTHAPRLLERMFDDALAHAPALFGTR